MQDVKLVVGCPNRCGFCKSSIIEPVHMVYPCPQFLEKDIRFMDYNILAQEHFKEFLGGLCCLKGYRFFVLQGFDYRRLNPDMLRLLFAANFGEFSNRGVWVKGISWAWDFNFGLQRKQKDIVDWAVKAGYRPKNLSVFILANWKIPFVDCMRKLDLLKVWGVKVNDCCFDGGYKRAIAKDWDPGQIKRFRAACRKHNQLIGFRIDPEW